MQGSSNRTIAPADLKAAAGNTAVRQIYDNNNWAALWTASSRKALSEALNARNRHGLDRVSFLNSDVAKLSGAQQDVAYTTAAIAYANALAFGIVDPASLHDVYTVPRPRQDLSAPLVQAIKDGRLKTWLKGLAPQDGSYASLANAYQAVSSTTGQGQVEIAPEGIIEVGDTDERVAEIAAVLVDDEYLKPADTGSGYGACLHAGVVDRDQGFAA